MHLSNSLIYKFTNQQQQAAAFLKRKKKKEHRTSFEFKWSLQTCGWNIQKGADMKREKVWTIIKATKTKADMYTCVYM